MEHSVIIIIGILHWLIGSSKIIKNNEIKCVLKKYTLLYYFMGNVIFIATTFLFHNVVITAVLFWIIIVIINFGLYRKAKANGYNKNEVDKTYFKKIYTYGFIVLIIATSIDVALLAPFPFTTMLGGVICWVICLGETVKEFIRMKENEEKTKMKFLYIVFMIPPVFIILYCLPILILSFSINSFIFKLI